MFGKFFDAKRTLARKSVHLARALTLSAAVVVTARNETAAELSPFRLRVIRRVGNCYQPNLSRRTVRLLFHRSLVRFSRQTVCVRRAMSRKDVVFVTGNVKKLEEVVQIFKNFYGGGPVPFNLTNKSVDLPEHQGERDDICRTKARAAFDIVGGPCIVEDTSLCFNAMGGLPGPYVKWFLKAVGPAGLHRMLEGFEDKTATAVCTIAYVDARGEVTVLSGETGGTIVRPMVAETFGWDSCFMPDGYDVTYAQMSKEEKNRISHRLKAMYKLKELLDQNPSS